MKRDDLARLLLSIALIAVAGCVDAIGFLETGHLFVSFMSGNSTQFTVGLAHLDWSKATLPGLFVGIFFIATFVGRLAEIYARGWSRPLILACEAVLLTAAGLVLSPTTAALILTIAAMGIQNSVVHKAAGDEMRLTYVTGTMVKVAEKLADALTSSSKRWGWLPDLLLWAGLICGALVGTGVYASMRLRGLLIPAGFLFILAVASLRTVRQRQPG